MRTIKFRGKRENGGQWVYGSYHSCTEMGTMRYFNYVDGNRKYEDKPTQFNSHWILTHHTPDSVGWDVRDTFYSVEVVPETVGQFTGFKDKNDKDIYEFDRDKAGNVVEFLNGCWCLNGDRPLTSDFEIHDNIWEPAQQ